MKHFALGIAHIALQFRQQRDSGRHRHVFKHVFLPVLAQRARFIGHLRTQVVGYYFLLGFVRQHAHNLFPEAVDGIIEPLSFAPARCQHHV